MIGSIFFGRAGMSGWKPGVLLLASALALGPPSAAASEAMLTTIWAFGSSGDGIAPDAGLIIDRTGALYGTTMRGGGAGCGGLGCGTAFRLIPPAGRGGPWTETVLHSFAGNGDGAYPVAGLIADSAGALYGTTYLGGSAGCGGQGCGTVFALMLAGASAWRESVLYRFCSTSDCSDGAFPLGGLMFGGSGALYGTTQVSGIGNGTVFQLSPAAGAWSESVLHHFLGVGDGTYPMAGLIADSAGALYGTTFIDSDSFASGGVVFRLAPGATAPWNESVLHGFGGGADGRGPQAALIADGSGALYGTTSRGGTGCTALGGCGTVFKLTPEAGGWRETVLYSFAGGNDGWYPAAGLVLDASGALYGTTANGGGAGCSSSSGCGTVFQLTPPNASGGAWTETVLHSFTGTDGQSPVAGLVFDASGALYGTTSSGGARGYGTAFKLTFSAAFAGTPGRADCVGQSTAALAGQYGSLVQAATALGYADAAALQNAVGAYCAGSPI